MVTNSSGIAGNAWVIRGFVALCVFLAVFLTSVVSRDEGRVRDAWHRDFDASDVVTARVIGNELHRTKGSPLFRPVLEFADELGARQQFTGELVASQRWVDGQPVQVRRSRRVPSRATALPAAEIDRRFHASVGGFLIVDVLVVGLAGLFLWKDRQITRKRLLRARSRHA